MSEALAYDTQPRAPNGHFMPLYSMETREALIDEICERLASGESLRSICQLPHMPNVWSAYAWINAGDETAQRMQHAREIGEDAIAADVMRIADGAAPLPGQAPDAQRDKLRVDTRLKLLAKFNPRRWGDGVQLRHADADGAKLETGGLVNDLLALMAPGQAIGNAQPSARVVREEPAQPTARVVNSQPIETQSAAPPKPAYRPRAARDDVSDLV